MYMYIIMYHMHAWYMYMYIIMYHMHAWYMHEYTVKQYRLCQQPTHCFHSIVSNTENLGMGMGLETRLD